MNFALNFYQCLSTSALVFLCIICIDKGFAVSHVSVLAAPNEKAALEKLRRLIIPEIPKTSHVHQYAQDDLYLLRWLQATSMDVHEAKKRIMRHLKWRSTENIDDIDKEDWSVIKTEFPMFIDGSDKEGRPVSEKWLNEWDFQQAIYDGKSEVLHRLMILECEMLTRHLYEARAIGKNITGTVVINDIEGFTFLKQVCPLCMTIWIDWVHLIENNYPGIYHKVYFLKANEPWNLVWRALAPYISEKTAESCELVSNKEKWLKVLNEDFHKGEISYRLGGEINLSGGSLSKF